jgi:hypothetical protein
VKTNAIEVEVVTLIGAARDDVERLEVEEREPTARSVELTLELREVLNRFNASTDEKERMRIARKADKLEEPEREARAEADEAQRRTITARAELTKLRAEASNLRRHIINQESRITHWATAVGEDIAASEREGFNTRDRSARRLRPLRPRAAELPQLIVAAVAAEAAVLADADAAKAEANRARFHRTIDEVLADPPDTEAQAKARVAAAGEAVKAAIADWCALQRERYHLRREIAKVERVATQSASEADAEAARLRAALRSGLEQRERELSASRARLFDLTGSERAEVEG